MLVSSVKCGEIRQMTLGLRRRSQLRGVHALRSPGGTKPSGSRPARLGDGKRCTHVDRLRVGFRERKRCSSDTYPESYTTEYTTVYEDQGVLECIIARAEYEIITKCLSISMRKSSPPQYRQLDISTSNSEQ